MGFERTENRLIVCCWNQTVKFTNRWFVLKRLFHSLLIINNHFLYVVLALLSLFWSMKFRFLSHDIHLGARPESLFYLIAPNCLLDRYCRGQGFFSKHTLVTQTNYILKLTSKSLISGWKVDENEKIDSFLWDQSGHLSRLTVRRILSELI